METNRCHLDKDFQILELSRTTTFNLGESGKSAGEASPAPGRAGNTAEDTPHISCHSLGTGHSLPDGSKSSGPAAKPGLQNMSPGTDKKSARVREVETWQQPVTWKQANL